MSLAQTLTISLSLSLSLYIYIYIYIFLSIPFKQIVAPSSIAAYRLYTSTLRFVVDLKSSISHSPDLPHCPTDCGSKICGFRSEIFGFADLEQELHKC
ncbi:hypothetical protein ACSBR2_004092 [Camellia fascicularis]